MDVEFGKPTLQALAAHAQLDGSLTVTTEQIKEWTGLEVELGDIHAKMIHLNREGWFDAFYAEGTGAFAVTLSELARSRLS